MNTAQGLVPVASSVSSLVSVGEGRLSVGRDFLPSAPTHICWLVFTKQDFRFLDVK